ncbi:MAG TPA: hypothetical protein VMF87_04945 [Streptosporangiaceae bacterium]|nr:hypothetical protein [Streptosporangiaceae bacterium]
MRKIVTALAVAALTLPVAAFSSSSAGRSSTSGTERFSGVLRGAPALANVTTYTLTFSGPVSTTGTIALGSGGNKKGDQHTIKTKAGNLVIVLDRNVGNGTASGNPTTCVFTDRITVPTTIVGSKSTGSWAGATGNFGIVALFRATGPRLSNGKCNTSSTAKPITSTAFSSFAGTGPVTVK